VKKFIFEDLESLYESAEYKKAPGKSPEAIFLNAGGEEVERVAMSGMKRDELNALMVAKGIPLKAEKEPSEETASTKHDEI